MNYSLTITALAVVVIKHVLEAAGVMVPETDIEKFLTVAVDIVAAVSIYVGRVRKGDLTWYGKRK